MAEPTSDGTEGVRTEVRRYERLLDETQAIVHVGSWEWEVETDRVSWSIEMFRIYGYEPGSLNPAYEHFLSRVHPDDRSWVSAAIDAAYRQRTSFDFDHRVVHPDGTVRIVHSRGRVVEGDGGPVRMVGTGQDVTEERARDHELREGRAFFQSTLDALNAHIAILDETGVIVAVNAAWRVFAEREGCAGARCGVGANYLDVCDATAQGPDQEDACTVADAIRDLVAGRRDAFSLEYPCHRPHPFLERWFRVRLTRFLDGGVRVVVAHENVTDEHRARRTERALAAEQAARAMAQRGHAQMVEMLERLTEGFVAIDRDWRYTYVNRRAGELLGRSADELLGRGYLEMFPEAEGRPFHLAYRRAMDEQVTLVLEEYYEPWDRWFENHVYPSPEGISIFFYEITERKHAEAERERLVRTLTAERALLATILEQLPVGVMVAEAGSGRALTENARFIELAGRSVPLVPTGASGEDMPEAALDTAGTPLAPERWPLVRSLRTGEVVPGEEMIVRRADRSERAMRINSAPIRDADGRITAAVVVLDDVTEVRRATELLRSQERILERVAAGAPLTSTLEEATALLEAHLPGSRACIKVLSEDGELVRQCVAPSMPAAYRDSTIDKPVRVRGAYARAIAGEDPVVVKDLAAEPDWVGDREPLLAVGVRAVWGTPVHGTQGEVVGLCGLYYEAPHPPSAWERDLTGTLARLIGLAIERKRVELALRETTERFALVARATSDAVYDYDIPGGRLTWNDAVFTTFRYPADEPVHSIGWWEERIHPEDRPRVVGGLQEVIDGGTTWIEEYRFRRGDGTYATVLDRGIATRDEAGRAIRMLDSMQDVSERIDLEAQLRQAQKMEAVGQLAGGVAHDFNNILTAIRCSAEFLAAGLPADDPLRDDVTEIQDATDRAASLTRQLLAFSRRQVVQPQVLELNAVVAETEKMLRRVIGEDVTLTTRLAAEAGRVRMDRGQLQQVLLNLAINARDAMPQGGALVIATGTGTLAPQPGRRASNVASGPHARLSVLDSGTGMDEATLARVFEPFFTTKPVGKGTGLGLSTVYGIVRQAGGRVSVQSEPGRGTTFDIFLPVVDDGPAGVPGPGAAASPAVSAAPGRGSGTVLLVEDDRSVRTVVRRVLQARGYTVLEARNGTEALQLLDRHGDEVRLVVSDVVMPEMGGRELVDRLAVERPGLRLLLMSGYTQGAVARRENLPPHVAFLEKPFIVEELVDTIRRLMQPTPPTDPPAG